MPPGPAHWPAPPAQQVEPGEQIVWLQQVEPGEPHISASSQQTDPAMHLIGLILPHSISRSSFGTGQHPFRPVSGGQQRWPGEQHMLRFPVPLGQQVEPGEQEPTPSQQLEPGLAHMPSLQQVDPGEQMVLPQQLEPMDPHCPPPGASSQHREPGVQDCFPHLKMPAEAFAPAWASESCTLFRAPWCLLCRSWTFIISASASSAASQASPASTSSATTMGKLHSPAARLSPMTPAERMMVAEPGRVVGAESFE